MLIDKAGCKTRLETNPYSKNSFKDFPRSISKSSFLSLDSFAKISKFIIVDC